MGDCGQAVSGGADFCFQLSKVLAQEFLPLKIRVNQIAVSYSPVAMAGDGHLSQIVLDIKFLLTGTLKPGIFPSQMTAGDSDPETHKSSLEGTGKGEKLPAGRPGAEADMAASALYLASYGGVL
jgi:NAD(P)-dependent dehydrogenase (short-subunit alcohol dehydrogenase family)